jgi:hypothetical protein
VQKFNIEIVKDGEKGSVKFSINDRILNFIKLDMSYNKGELALTGSRYKTDIMVMPTEEIEEVNILQYLDYYFDNKEVLTLCEKVIYADMENIKLTSFYNVKAFIKEEGFGYSDFEYREEDPRKGVAP